MSAGGNGSGTPGSPPSPDTKRHHETIVITALVISVAVVVLGLLLANFVYNALKGEGSRNSGVRQYNGFEFTKVSSSWFTQWERDGVTYNLEFRHPPWEVENITVRGSVDRRFQRTFFFLTHDPTDEMSRQTSFVALASADLALMLKSVFERQAVAACTRNETAACADRPIATCSTNASVIYVKVSNETGVFLDGNCATFQGVEENLTMAADKAMYQWLGIIMR